jgi:nitroreductase
MEFLDVGRTRRTTNGPFSREPVSVEHQRPLVDVAGMAPSHFNGLRNRSTGWVPSITTSERSWVRSRW